MKITKLSVGFSFTKQLKQYEPVRVESHCEAELEEGDDRTDTVKSLFRLCKDDVRAQLRELINDAN